MISDCSLCAIIDGQDQDLVAYRTQQVFVMPTLKQRTANSGQVIVCPFAHATSLQETAGSLLSEIFDVVARVTAAAPMAFGALGTTVLTNNDAPDQTLSHLHVHVIPRFPGDNLVIPDSQNIVASREQRLELALKLRRVLSLISK